MAAYNVAYKIRSTLASLPESAKVEQEPVVARVSASDATRAISQVINDLKNDGTLHSKSEIIVLEAKVVA
ncbi:MAG: hypothetical protein PHW63_09705 [Alphaproteobacteria bacterium]|nr:hypothetical protein [Alphaproteobacteria bacterium]